MEVSECVLEDFVGGDGEMGLWDLMGRGSVGRDVGAV
jgi:hypothetical protein